MMEAKVKDVRIKIMTSVQKTRPSARVCRSIKILKQLFEVGGK